MALGVAHVLPDGGYDPLHRGIDWNDWEDFRKQFRIKPAVKLINNEWVPVTRTGWDNESPAVLDKRLMETWDAVDNVIYELAESLARPFEDQLKWDMEYIGSIRDTLIEYIERYTSLTEEDIYPSYQT